MTNHEWEAQLELSRSNALEEVARRKRYITWIEKEAGQSFATIPMSHRIKLMAEAQKHEYGYRLQE